MSDLPKGTVTTLAIIFLAALIDGLDACVVNVSLPTMAAEFGVSLGHSSWLVFAYVMALAALLLPLGKMAKNGRVKRFMVLGTALFGISSVACGLSHDFWVLVAFRFLQGLSAAMMSSVLPSMVVHMLPLDRKGLGMSVMGASSGLALILGPVVGGAIVGALSWEWLFFINIPVCIVIIILAQVHMPKDGPSDPDKDPSPAGAISAVLLIASVLTILEEVGDPQMRTVSRIFCSVVAVVSLIVLIRSIRKDSVRTVISPQVLRNREYLIIGCAFLLCTVVVAGATYLLPYMLQGYWHMTPFESGMYLSVVSIAMCVLVLPVGWMCDRYGCKWPSAAAAVLRAAFCGIMIYLTIEGCDPIILIVPLIVFGASHAFSGTAQPTRMIHHATPGLEDESTNLMLVINYVASALGCVLFAMIFGIFSSGTISTMGPEQLKEGFIPVMWFSIIILIVALICTLSVKNKIVRKE